MIVNIGLSGWFVAPGLGVMVEQPDSRGSLCFFVAIFSLATEFDVCPVDWYIHRMEFLGRAPVLHAVCRSSGSTKPADELGIKQIVDAPLTQNPWCDFRQAVQRWRESGELGWALRAKRIMNACQDRLAANLSCRMNWPEESPYTAHKPHRIRSFQAGKIANPAGSRPSA